MRVQGGMYRRRQVFKARAIVSSGVGLRKERSGILMCMPLEAPQTTSMLNPGGFYIMMDSRRALGRPVRPPGWGVRYGRGVWCFAYEAKKGLKGCML